VTSLADDGPGSFREASRAFIAGLPAQAEVFEVPAPRDKNELGMGTAEGAPAMIVRLTPRERQILTLAAFSNGQIARRLGVGTQSIKNKWTRIYRKLGLNGGPNKRIQAVMTALCQGILFLDELHPGDRRAYYEE
jgi:DNA-binding NarL/FixJ family response regulator